MLAGSLAANAGVYSLSTNSFEVLPGGTVTIPVQLTLTGSEDGVYKSTEFKAHLSNANFSLADIDVAADRTVSGKNYDPNIAGVTCSVVGKTPDALFVGTSGDFILLTISVGSATVGETCTLTIDEALGANVSLVETPFTVSPDPLTATITVTNTVTLDENETAAPADASGVDARVLRTLKADVWNTICLPFAIANPTTVFGAGTQVADFTGVTNGDDLDDDDFPTSITINFATATTMEANHPYLIKVPVALSEFTVSSVDIAADQDAAVVSCDELKTKVGSKWYYFYNSFIGTYEAGTIVPIADDSQTNLFLQNNNFMASDGTASLKAFRGYFSFDVGILSPTAYATSPVKDAITFSIDGIETGIDSIEGFENANEGWYDLNGRKLGTKPAAKGIYINNGKKVVIK